MLRLDDGRRVNLMSARRLDALADLLTGLARSAPPAWVLLTGNSRESFAAGADLGEIAGLDAASAIALSRAGSSVTARLHGGPWWTGAVVDGHALGGGFDLAAACDLLIATPRARFAHPGIARSMFTGWGGTRTIPRRGRAGRLRAALMTGERLSAEDAHVAGLVAAVAAPRRAVGLAVSMLDRLATWGEDARDAWRAAHCAAPAAVLARARAAFRTAR
ncbi:MAG: enoyl-CoA hydratase/isomerase family protein [Acidobacteriota bacterium]|nr:enoyl-CoA hydratase/isomerase family protein [Acidobacteriota bacterium]